MSKNRFKVDQITLILALSDKIGQKIAKSQNQPKNKQIYLNYSKKPHQNMIWFDLNKCSEYLRETASVVIWKIYLTLQAEAADKTFHLYFSWQILVKLAFENISRFRLPFNASKGLDAGRDFIGSYRPFEAIMETVLHVLKEFYFKWHKVTNCTKTHEIFIGF